MSRGQSIYEAFLRQKTFSISQSSLRFPQMCLFSITILMELIRWLLCCNSFWSNRLAICDCLEITLSMYYLIMGYVCHSKVGLKDVYLSAVTSTNITRRSTHCTTYSLLTPPMILYVSSGTYSLTSTPNDRFFFEKLFHGKFYLLSEICWEKIAEEIFFFSYFLIFRFDV